VAESAADGLDEHAGELGGVGVVRTKPPLPKTFCPSVGPAGRGRVLGTVMVSILSIGVGVEQLVPHGPATERGDCGPLALCGWPPDNPAISDRYARIGAAVSSPISPSWWAAKAIRSPR
jgi:hypothetical protein